MPNLSKEDNRLLGLLADDGTATFMTDLMSKPDPKASYPMIEKICEILFLGKREAPEKVSLATSNLINAINSKSQLRANCEFLIERARDPSGSEFTEVHNQIFTGGFLHAILQEADQQKVLDEKAALSNSSTMSGSSSHSVRSSQDFLHDFKQKSEKEKALDEKVNLSNLNGGPSSSMSDSSSRSISPSQVTHQMKNALHDLRQNTVNTLEESQTSKIKELIATLRVEKDNPFSMQKDRKQQKIDALMTLLKDCQEGMPIEEAVAKAKSTPGVLEGKLSSRTADMLNELAPEVSSKLSLKG